jgi:methionyl-tRNA formyltransferase
VIAVVTRPDRERGRGRGGGKGREVLSSPVKELGLQEELPILQPEKATESIFEEVLKRLHPDLFVVVAYGQILPKSILKIPSHGAVNVHASLLPKYRGAAPIAWAILKGEKVSGVTIIMMDEGMDTGDILLQKPIPIGEDETSATLHEKLAGLGAQLLLETLERMKAETLRPIPQDHSKASYAPSLKKVDGHIDWRKEAIEIDRQVRAFNPWPGVFTEWEGRFLKIYKGEVREGVSTGKPGVVIWVGSDFIEVGTGKDSFLIKEVQVEGKKKMNIRDFISGHPISVGTIFV